jgi:ADP-heptose:LPS heptosyltransferase
MNNTRSGILLVLGGVRRRLSYFSSRFIFYNEYLPRAHATSQYIVEEKFAFLKHVGVESTKQGLLLPWEEKDLKPARTFNQRVEPMRVVLSPTHRREARRWPTDNYRELACLLRKHWQADVTWLWGPGEKDFVEGVADSKLTPALTLKELAAFLAQQDLFIGNANGPSHIAVASGICSAQWHGPTRATSWSPCSERHIAIQAPSDMASLSVESVWEALQRAKPAFDSQHQWRLKRGWKTNWLDDGIE